MPSRADGTRVPLEWAARSAAIAALLGLLWTLTRPTRPAGPELFEGGGLEAALVRWTRARPVDSLHLELGSAPDAAIRDWLVALRASGVGLSWRAPDVPSIAIASERIADPRVAVRIAIAGPSGAKLSVHDAVGPLDSVTTGSLGGTVVAPIAGTARVELGEHVATAPAADSVILRRLLVLGLASWESRFVIAALEEHGWTIDARLEVAPGAVVRQGPAGPIDTGRYAAVIVLDSSAAPDAERLSRYVRSGGGLVLAGSASGAPALGRLAPARTGERFQPTSSPASTNTMPSALGYYPLQPGSSVAITLEEQRRVATVVAHRLEAGRVVQIGYDETWRWRMTGGEDGPAAHRAWWAGIVSAAAFAPTVSPEGDAIRRTLSNDAPLASLFASLGPPRSAPAAEGGLPAQLGRMRGLLFALAVLAFLAEWTSRRLRGAA